MKKPVKKLAKSSISTQRTGPPAIGVPKAVAPESATKRSQVVQAAKAAKPLGSWHIASAAKKGSQPKTLAGLKAPSAKPRATLRRSAPKTEIQYSARPEKFKDTYGRVLAVVSKMRREKVSLTQASRDVGIDPRSVTRWGAPALHRGLNGKYSARKQDSLLRLVLIPTPEGPREIAVRSSKQVKLLAEYWNALHRYLQTGDATKLKTFEGKHITDANGVAIPLSVDLAALNRLGSAGVLSFESIYARTA